MALLDELLVELKNRLQVTWNDDGTNASLTSMISRGQNYLNELCGTTFTFAPDSSERELLLERCRYDYNNALDEFETNFSNILARLILTTAVSQYVPESGTSGTTT